MRDNVNSCTETPIVQRHMNSSVSSTRLVLSPFLLQNRKYGAFNRVTVTESYFYSRIKKSQKPIHLAWAIELSEPAGSWIPPQRIGGGIKERAKKAKTHLHLRDQLERGSCLDFLGKICSAPDGVRWMKWKSGLQHVMCRDCPPPHPPEHIN